MKEELDRRIEDWKKQLKKHASQIRRLFSVFLSNKGHAGHIKFDHEHHTLHVTVLFPPLFLFYLQPYFHF